MPRLPLLPRLLLPLLGAILAGGCVPVDDSAGIVPCTSCSLTDANNFAYSAALDIDVVPVAANAPVRIDWSGLTHDVQGHPLDLATDIAGARLIAFRDITPAAVARGLANDDLEQADVSLFVTCTPTTPGCGLDEFGVLGNPVDVPTYFSEGSATWLVALTSTFEAGAAAFVFLEPKDASLVTSAAIGDDTSALDVDVDFASLTPVVVPAGEAALHLDWSGLTRDGLGNELSLDAIDGIFLGRYTESPAELEGRVFDLETLAAETWEAPVDGLRSLGLGTLRGDTVFAGIDDTSTWLLALRCSSCINPTPRFVTFLRGAEPSDAQ
jgi:hypothetical protein